MKGCMGIGIRPAFVLFGMRFSLCIMNGSSAASAGFFAVFTCLDEVKKGRAESQSTFKDRRVVFLMK